MICDVSDEWFCFCVFFFFFSSRRRHTRFDCDWSSDVCSSDLARIEGGRWSAVRNTRGNFDEPGRWAGLLDRERHRVGGDEASEGVYVHAPRSGKAPSIEGEAWTFRSLALAPAEGLAPAESEPFAMALCAL